MSENLIVNLSDGEFDQLTFESPIPSMVMFGAERCNVCKELYPTIEEIAEEYADKMKVFWVDVDKYKLLIKRFRLKGIPNLMIFNNGEIKNRMGGLRSKEELIEIINRALEIG